MMKDDFSARIITLSEAYDMAYEVSQQLTAASVNFDIVLGISRGGLPPARMICDFLNIKTLTSIQIRHYTGGGEAKENVTITDSSNVDLDGKNILIVDDVNDSGKTLEAAHKHASSANASLVKTAVLHEKERTSFKADYTGSDLSGWKWLIYQWAVTEDLLEFLRRDNMVNAEPYEAIKHLEDTYGLKIDENLFKKVMSMKDQYFNV